MWARTLGRKLKLVYTYVSRERGGAWWGCRWLQSRTARDREAGIAMLVAITGIAMLDLGRNVKFPHPSGEKAGG